MPSLLLMLVLFLSCLCTPLTISSSTTTATATATISSRHYHHHHHRRILHQPLFPFDHPFTSAPLPAPAPSPTPHPQPQSKEISPKYPFSSQSPPTDNSPPLSFFPFYPSPPPPPPPPSSTAIATFPANISSLILPQSHSPSKPISRKLIAVVVSVSLLSASLITAVAAFLLHHRHHHQFYSTKDDSRTDSLRLYPPNTATSDGNHKPQPPPTPPPLRNVSSTSSEFLYLGTLVSSRDATDNDDKNSLNCNFGTTTPSVSGGGYQRLGSPELRPLPPLPRHHHFQSTQQSAAADSDDQHEEEFFSPRGSTSGSPNRFESSYGRAFEAAQLGSRSSNSRNNSYPSSNSASPTQSQSPTVPLNLSPTSLMSRSPDSVVNFPAPPRPIPPPPPRERKNLSPSPPPERNSGDTQNSPARVSDVSKQNQLSPARKQSVPVKLPPPPPPLPPPRFWETTMGPSQIHYPITGPPPELVAPSRPVVFQNGETTVLQQNVESVERNEELQRPKLKPLHWDKVRASSDRAMVWDQLKSSSFQLNEEMIETLFMANSSNMVPKDNNRRPILMAANQENRVLDPKKSQNIAILLRALNVTVDEVCEALVDGNADTLGTELLESLLKMAPTKEEEFRLKEFKDESPFKLGPAEKFLKAVLNIPFAFQRVDAMLYVANFDSEVEYLRRSFETLEAACKELRNSRMFLKLLDAVLKTGNRMNVGTNRGDAHAFKLDTLLKLVDIKGTDGKTTLLHFVVQEIIRAEGSHLAGVNENPTTEKNHQTAFWDDVEFRKLGLQVVSGLSGELTNVKKAAAMDSDVLTNEVAKLATGVTKITEVLKLNEDLALKESSRKFSGSMIGFLKKAEEEIVNIKSQERVTLSMVKEITEYFHGNSVKEEAHPFRIFMVVRDFLSILDQVCREVGKINDRTIVSSGRQFPVTVNQSLPPVFPGLNESQPYSSSDDESSSPTCL